MITALYSGEKVVKLWGSNTANWKPFLVNLKKRQSKIMLFSDQSSHVSRRLAYAYNKNQRDALFLKFILV